MRIVKWMILSILFITNAAYSSNDRWDEISLNAVVRVTHDHLSEQRLIEVGVENDFTNTLECEGIIPIKVKTDQGYEIIDYRTRELLAYPNGAFGAQLFSEIEVHLDQGMSFPMSYSKSFQITCKGYNHRLPLPREFCEATERLQSHYEVCEYLSSLPGNGGFKQYPFMLGEEGYYLGACRCYD